MGSVCENHSLQDAGQLLQPLQDFTEVSMSVQWSATILRRVGRPVNGHLRIDRLPSCFPPACHPNPPLPPPAFSTFVYICRFTGPVPIHAASRNSISVLQNPLARNSQPWPHPQLQKYPVTPTWPIRIWTRLTLEWLGQGWARDWIPANEGRVLSAETGVLAFRRRSCCLPSCHRGCGRPKIESALRNADVSAGERRKPGVVRRLEWAMCKVGSTLDFPAVAALRSLSCWADLYWPLCHIAGWWPGWLTHSRLWEVSFKSSLWPEGEDAQRPSPSAGPVRRSQPRGSVRVENGTCSRLTPPHAWRAGRWLDFRFQTPPSSGWSGAGDNVNSGLKGSPGMAYLALGRSLSLGTLLGES